MGTKILSFILLALTVILSSCSGDPIVGEWVPDNDTSGNVVNRINSDGTAKYYGNATDGTYSMTGKWNRVEDNDKTITVKYDASTIKADLDNPIAEELIKAVLKEMASNTLTLTLSDDGERLYGGGNGYFVRY